MFEDDDNTDPEMYVIKRNGEREILSFDKIMIRIKVICNEANLKIQLQDLTMKVISQLKDGISTTKIDELTAEQCASMSSIHPDYNTLAGRIAISNLHKNTPSSFSSVMKSLYEYKDKQGNHSPLVDKKLYEFVVSNDKELDSLVVDNNDYLIDFFGFKTLERSYLMKINSVIVERPQYMWLRVSIGIHGTNWEKIRESYFHMSNKYYTHATPTLFNAGTPHPQLSSCYLVAMESDSIEGIYNTLKDCALISKWAGGIGLHIHNIRSTGSHIRGTNGTSNGIVPLLRVFNNTAKYVDQCIIPETIIYTTDGPKQIQHCIGGDTAIYGIGGEAEIIQNVLEHPYEGELLEIETTHSIMPLKITPEHPVYVLRGEGLSDDMTEEQLKNSLSTTMSKLEWVDAKDLEENDYIVHSIPTYEKDISTITTEDCYMYGLIFRYGILKEGEWNITIHSHSHNEKVEEIVTFIHSYLNKKVIDFRMENEVDVKVVYWKPSPELPFRYNDVYDENQEKRIYKKWLNLPIEKVSHIWKGINNNGYGEKEENNSKFSENDTVRFILLRMGILPHNPTNLRYENFLFSRIHKITTNSYKGVLYDLQMEKEHNYLLHNGLVHNGGGRRNGSFAIYLEPWHGDIDFFLEMRKNHGDEELKARDLFYALWIPDLFMERIKADGPWTLMCPDECPGLADVYGDAFVELYTRYEREGKGRKTVKARELWFKILDAQMETGTPYLLYKDACNKKSNQQNVGTIKSSNLCSEIVEYSNAEETAVCNLASIALPAFIKERSIDYEKLHAVAKMITYNLNRIIDINYYPTEKTRRSNLRHRPIGIGVQGLADLFMAMDVPFSSEEAKTINRNVFETIYHGALEASYEEALKDGPYETFHGSPCSKGLLQFDLWGFSPTNARYDWDELKGRIKEGGLRNSLLLAPMPTASTSQILGYNECIEPITSNIYSRRTIAGEFIVINRFLMGDLMKLHLWNDKIKNSIIANNGSIQHLEFIPDNIREKYKTVWEIPMKHLIDMASDRGVFICQSQSLNLWLEEPTYSSLTSMHFYAWSKGLKTGIYYLRRRGRHQAQQFTIEPVKKEAVEGQLYEETEEEICEMCSA